MKKYFRFLMVAAALAIHNSSFIILHCNAEALQWQCSWPEAKAQTFSLYHGETATFEPTFRINGTVATNIEISAVWYQTNGMGNAWWPLENATFHPTNDVGAASYRFFVEGRTTGGSPVASDSGVIYRANGTLRMLDSPGFVPNSVPIPPQVLDFAAIQVANAPYYTQEESDAAVQRAAAALQSDIAAKADAVVVTAVITNTTPVHSGSPYSITNDVWLCEWSGEVLPPTLIGRSQNPNDPYVRWDGSDCTLFLNQTLSGWKFEYNGTTKTANDYPFYPSSTLDFGDGLVLRRFGSITITTNENAVVYSDALDDAADALQQDIADKADLYRYVEIDDGTTISTQKQGVVYCKYPDNEFCIDELYYITFQASSDISSLRTGLAAASLAATNHTDAATNAVSAVVSAQGERLGVAEAAIAAKADKVVVVTNYTANAVTFTRDDVWVREPDGVPYLPYYDATYTKEMAWITGSLDGQVTGSIWNYQYSDQLSPWSLYFYEPDGAYHQEIIQGLSSNATELASEWGGYTFHRYGPPVVSTNVVQYVTWGEDAVTGRTYLDLGD